jgi:peptidoglycan/xylan/chitin deacetylase (PgdA/CDA1 family)
MRSTLGLRGVLAAMISLGTTALLAAEPGAKPSAPVVILKLDDVTRNGAHGAAAVSPRWQRCMDFLRQEQVKSSLGIIGKSLEADHEAYFQWIKDLDRAGLVEFWNHGYEDKADQFNGTPVDQQRSALEKTQRLAKEKLGLHLRVFGVHWSPIDAATDAALAGLPEIKIWFEGPAKPKGGQTVLKRTIYMEKPTFVPNVENLKTCYEKFGHQQPYLLLQGHPNQWTDERFAAFMEIVKYLKAKGCAFMRVSEYVDSAAKVSK